jgi:hypothetical protein
MNLKLIYPKLAKLFRQAEFHLPSHVPVVVAAASPGYVDVEFVDENLNELGFDEQVVSKEMEDGTVTSRNRALANKAFDRGLG